jgi:hypothetical protein
MGLCAKSYMRKGFLIYEEMRKYLTIYEEAIMNIPSNRVISSLEGKFGTVGEPFVLVLEGLFMKISNLCKNHL